MSPLLEVLTLASDVLVRRVEDLSPPMLAQLGEVSPGEMAVARARSRERPMLLGADAAALLQCFLEPCTVSEAIVRFCASRGQSPESVFEQAMPLLLRLSAARILVAAGERQIEGGLPAGTRVGELEILRPLMLLDDSEVYLAQRGAERAVIKLAASSSDVRLREKLASEKLILEHLGGQVGPALLGAGEHHGRPFLALEWLRGEDVLTSSNRLRRAGGPGAQAALISMIARIAAAYAALHDKGVVHGDVHPMNVRVAPDGGVRLIDFGTARFLSSAPSGFVEPPREGVPYFFEPEAAAAFLLQARAPAANPAGEQYGIAALCHLLFTGRHCLDFSIEHQELLRQISDDLPVAWAARPGMPQHPELEALLFRALAKAPDARLPSVGAMAAALSALVPANAPRVFERRAEPARADLLRRLAGLPSALEAAMAEPPTASVMFGAAGTALALQRTAMLEASAGLLSAADVWSARAERAPAAGAHHRADWGIEGFSPSSLFHGRPGIELVRASIAHARWDLPALRVALAAFVSSSQREEPRQVDLTMGSSGTLLGCAKLVETLPEDPLIDRRPLLALGDRTAAALWAALEALPPVADAAGLASLGLAHGWAGMLFAQLRWIEALHRRPPAGLQTRLEQLLALARPRGDGLFLSRAVESETAGDRLAESWCNGAAGQVLLFLAAHRVYRDPAFLDAAGRFGRFASRGEGDLGSLCCGHAGVGFSMLSLFRATGYTDWRAAAGHALVRARAGRHPQSSTHSLFKGELGAALLAVELEQAEDSAFPLLE